MYIVNCKFTLFLHRQITSTMNKKKIWQEICNWFMITVGLALFTFSWSAFLIPNQLTGGGVSGIAAVLHFATSSIPVGLTTLVINVILILIAWKILGPKFCINTLICTGIIALFFSIWEMIFTQPLVNDTFMCALIGAALSGAGMGLALSFGGNTGGTDIIALIIGKYRNISFGRISLYSNILIVASSYLTVHSIEKLVYSMVVMFVSAYIVDVVIDGYKQTFQFFVFSSKNEEIAERINKDLHRGATLLKGYGSYSKTDSDILLVIAHRTDRVNIIRIIKEIDDTAFISVVKTNSVFGKNFDRLKL